MLDTGFVPDGTHYRLGADVFHALKGLLLQLVFDDSAMLSIQLLHIIIMSSCVQIFSSLFCRCM